MNGGREESESVGTTSRLRAWGVFVVLCLASLGLLSIVDDSAWNVSMRIAPSFAFLGRYRIASLGVCVALCTLVAGRAAFRFPSTEAPWRMVAGVAAMWVIGTGVAVLGFKVWTPTLHFRDAADYTSFLGTGLLGEELLFRGALYAAASRVFRDHPAFRLGPIVWSTAVLFAAAHAQYHGFRLTSASVVQVLYTLPAGLVFGFVRKHTGSVWPGTALHLLCNLLSVVRSA
jgi:membrane protease YdiL (CAAX protease family)